MLVMVPVVAQMLRRSSFALVLGLILTPLAPDTGAVHADPSIQHRVETAHALATESASDLLNR